MSLLPKAPLKTGTQSTAVKKPKTKKLADPFGKKSLFFKSEDFDGLKHPNVEKLRGFLESHRVKNNPDKSNS